MNQDVPGYLFTMDIEGLQKFVSEKEGALNIIEQLRGGAKNRWPYAQVRDVIMALIKQPKHRVYQTYAIPGGEFTVSRARRLLNHRGWFLREEDLGPPPPDKMIDPGRCHQPNRPLCYCSLHPEIALSELNPEMGERFVIAEFRFEQNIIAMPVGELDYYRRTGETYLGSAIEGATKPFDDTLVEPNAVIPVLIDAFLADEFIKPAITDTDYKITSAFSDIILNEFGPTHKVDALVYPSVAFRGGLNFAIQPESLKLKMKLIDAEVIEITDVVGYGIFGRKQLGKLKSITDGRLDWNQMEF
ncbi:MAG TPA: RES domain-containing protein [Gallionella sp.]|nr:RES domain-containing protein [Gallionella sp.]